MGVCRLGMPSKNSILTMQMTEQLAFEIKGGGTQCMGKLYLFWIIILQCWRLHQNAWELKGGPGSFHTETRIRAHRSRALRV